MFFYDAVGRTCDTIPICDAVVILRDLNTQRQNLYILKIYVYKYILSP